MSKARQLADNGAATPNRNMVINGAMNVAQRSTSETGVGGADGYITVDRFDFDQNTNAGRMTLTQESDGPSGFANCTKFACTTADTSLASGQHFVMRHLLEGQNLQRLKKGTADAEPITVSFYVKGNASATYVCELHDGSRQISKTFAVTTSWNRIELNFPADTSGAIDDDNTVGIFMIWHFSAGSDTTGGTLNSSSWASSVEANRAAGISNFFDSTDRTFFITGVQMEVGSSATPFEHKTFAQDLIECQRYYTQETAASGSAYKRFGQGSWNISSAGSIFIPLSTPMRDSSPTLVSKAAANYLIYSANATDACTALAINTESNNGTHNRLVALTFGTSSGGVSGEALSLVGNNDTASYIALDAEL